MFIFLRKTQTSDVGLLSTELVASLGSNETPQLTVFSDLSMNVLEIKKLLNLDLNHMSCLGKMLQIM